MSSMTRADRACHTAPPSRRHAAAIVIYIDSIGDAYGFDLVGEAADVAMAESAAAAAIEAFRGALRRQRRTAA